MDVFIPAIILVRFVALALEKSVSMKAEIAFFAICTALGAFNDWNSVCNKKIYDYTVPYEYAFSTIPLWMLLFWGMILRFIARFARWQGLGAPEKISDRTHLGFGTYDSPALKVAVQLGLVLVTRQAIYRLYMDPVWSWLPFLLALAVFFAVFRPGRHDYRLVAAFLVGGPLIEIIYIQLGDLHRYHLGWIGGVPLWIAIWWLVIVLIWKDLAFRMEKYLLEKLPAA
jgi:hypothetical protein